MKTSAQTQSDSLPLLLLKGLVVGLVATQTLDLIGTAILNAESDEDWRDENAARGGKQAYERGVAKIAKGFGKTLTREEEKVWGWRFHKVFGVMGGIQYMMLRKKYPQIAKGYGLAFGTGFFILADEIMIQAAGLVPGPFSFSWKAHARGAAAHIGYGVAAEMTALALENLDKVLIPEDRYLVPQNEGVPSIAQRKIARSSYSTARA